MIDPIYLITAAACVLVLLVTSWLMRDRRRPRAHHAPALHCFCGAHGARQPDGQVLCSQHAWNLGGRPRDRV